MSYKPFSLFRLLEDISHNELLLPHIQRPFVWDEEQMVRLFDSLMRNYPIQTLLFWRTKEAIKARRFMDVIERDIELSTLYESAKSVAGVEKTFVLDGQQRIQTLYAIFRGGITSPIGETSEAYFDVTAGGAEIDGGDLLHELRFSSQPLTASDYRIRNLLQIDAAKNAEEIADEVNDKLETVLAEPQEQRKQREKQVRRNFGQLCSLLREEKHFWIQVLDGIASEYAYRKILDIFVRVNSGGTKLTAADLMFASMKEGWEDIEENTEQTVEMLNDGRLGFDRDFTLKCMLVTLGKGAEIHTEKFIGANGEQLLQSLQTNWPKAEQTFRQLRDFIEQDLRLFSDKVVRSYNAFVPVFDYLFDNSKPTEGIRVLMRAYYNKAQLFNWFKTGTDTVLNALHKILKTSAKDCFPVDEIKGYFASRGLATQLSQQHWDDKGLRSLILSMVYVERWGTSPFKVLYKGNEPHADHIYPQYMLRSRLNQSSTEINDIGNLRFVGATDNIRKRAELPSSYFSRLKTDGVDIEKHLLLRGYADNPNKLAFDAETYLQFRTERRGEIWKLAKRIVDPEAI